MRKKVHRGKVLSEVRKLETGTIIAMEACASSNYWGRTFAENGYQVRLIAAQHVKPFRKSQKNDDNDSEAIAEAAQRPTMRFIPVKSVEQQQCQTLLRARQQVVDQRSRERPRPPPSG